MSTKEIAVFFVGKRRSGLLHGQFFGDGSPTDCMTFPMGDNFLGECVICPKVALEENPSDPYSEVSLYLIHCLLHLIGYDDIDQPKRKIMHKEQARLLKRFKESQCLLHP